MSNPVVHFEIVGPDGAGLREFYSKLFDWKIDVQEAMENYGMVESGGEGGIGGGIFQSQEGMPNNYVTIYALVDDLQEYLNKAESLGGHTIVPPTPIPGMGAFAMLTDPQGNAIGIYRGS